MNTFLEYTTSTRSQAIAKHEAYVLKPSMQATRDEQKTAYEQLKQIAAKKRLQAQKVIETTAPAEFLHSSCCSPFLARGVDWYPFGSTHYRLTVNYFIETDGSIAFDRASIYVVNGGGDTRIWQYYEYAGYTYE